MLNPSIIARQWTVNIQQGTHPQCCKSNAQECLPYCFFRFKIDWNAYPNGETYQGSQWYVDGLSFHADLKLFVCYCLQESDSRDASELLKLEGEWHDCILLQIFTEQGKKHPKNFRAVSFGSNSCSYIWSVPISESSCHWNKIIFFFFFKLLSMILAQF